MVGSKIYDEKDSDWACEEDFILKEKYLEVDDEIFNKMPWDKFLEEMVEILKNFLTSEDYKESIFYSTPHITVGFDDGDLKIIK
jgi:hypothetical protein